eukprot:TRINITY_DN14251_c0_g1_i1.p1 TRINITY_DN14251_c0_g1~~TRINITY_DN14251_c0_g1_i1.p1  ORF type:complete len:550 (-),score=95.79 TRINITY_DN14251_c0_g1_i1:39-1622(-)
MDIKLGDFGLSTVLKREGKSTTAVGTLGYAAPEVVRHKPYDSKSDMYGLGCSLYEMMTLRSVFEDQRAGLFPVPIPKDRYSSALERLMISLIGKDPERRPTAKEVLKQGLLIDPLQKIKVEAQIYGELQQREEENQQLLLKVRMLDTKIARDRRASERLSGSWSTRYKRSGSTSSLLDNDESEYDSYFEDPSTVEGLSDDDSDSLVSSTSSVGTLRRSVNFGNKFGDSYGYLENLHNLSKGYLAWIWVWLPVVSIVLGVTLGSVSALLRLTVKLALGIALVIGSDMFIMLSHSTVLPVLLVTGIAPLLPNLLFGNLHVKNEFWLIVCVVMSFYQGPILSELILRSLDKSQAAIGNIQKMEEKMLVFRLAGTNLGTGAMFGILANGASEGIFYGMILGVLFEISFLVLSFGVKSKMDAIVETQNTWCKGELIVVTLVVAIELVVSFVLLGMVDLVLVGKSEAGGLGLLEKMVITVIGVGMLLLGKITTGEKTSYRALVSVLYYVLVFVANGTIVVKTASLGWRSLLAF